MPREIEQVLDGLYEGEGFKIVKSSTNQILGNLEIEADHTKGLLYFDGCTKFTNSLVQVLIMLTDRIKLVSEDG